MVFYRFISTSALLPIPNPHLMLALSLVHSVPSSVAGLIRLTVSSLAVNR